MNTFIQIFWNSISWIDLWTNLILTLILFLLGTHIFRKPSFTLLVRHENDCLVFYLENKKHYINYQPGEINIKLYLPPEFINTSKTYHIQKSTGWTEQHDIPNLSPKIHTDKQNYRLLRLDNQRMCFPASSTGLFKISTIKIKELDTRQIYFVASTKYGFFPFYCRNELLRNFLIRHRYLPKAKQEILT